MAKFKKRRKMGKFGRILAFVLCGALIIGALGSVVAFAKNDTKPVSSLKFSRGTINSETGIYEESNKSIYTEKPILAKGLRIEPDFESTVTYDVYYYDKDDVLLEKTLGLTGVYEQEYEFAQYARIVIHPEIPDDVREKDFEIKFWEINKYASMLSIKNSIKSSVYGDFVNLFDETEAMKGYTIVADDDATFNVPVEYPSAMVSNIIKCDDISSVDVLLKFSIPPQQSLHVCYVDENGVEVEHDFEDHYYLGSIVESKWVTVTFEIPKDAVEMRFEMPYDADCYIYGYND